MAGLHLLPLVFPLQQVASNAGGPLAARLQVSNIQWLQAEHPISSPGGGIRDARLDKDILGRTPQQLAQIRGHSALARLLDPSFDLRVLSPR
jgi:hypothetical protein